MLEIELGRTYKDRITGFTGMATGRCEYITGCNQILLAPKCTDISGSTKPDVQWFDEQRLVVCTDVPLCVIDNGINPGCDMEAPIK